MNTPPGNSEHDGRFRWNAGGWFGGQLGMTVWMLVAAVVLYRTHPGTAFIVLGLFAVANLVGTRLWASRARLTALSALQALVATAGLCSLATVYVAERSGAWERIQGYGGAISARAAYVLIVVLVLGLMLVLWSQGRGGQGDRKDDGT